MQIIHEAFWGSDDIFQRSRLADSFLYHLDETTFFIHFINFLNPFLIKTKSFIKML